MHTIARALVVALLVGILGAASAAADDDAGWTVRTADNDFGSNRDNYGYTLDPGGQLDDGLVVANNGTTPLDLAVYAADAFTTDEGQLDLRTRAVPATGVGAWVHTGQDHLTVQPGRSVEVPFTVSVPDNATPGDHMGGIVTSLTQGNVERRVGIRIQLRVGGDLEPSLSVEDLDVRYSGTAFGKGDATVTYAIHNTGNAILTARQAVSVAGPFDTWTVHSGLIDDSPRLLPGETWHISVPVHGVTPTFQLTATVTLVPLLTDAVGSTAPLPTNETSAHGWAIPWVLLLVVLCVLAVLVLVARRRRRKRAGGIGARSEAPIPVSSRR